MNFQRGLEIIFHRNLPKEFEDFHFNGFNSKGIWKYWPWRSFRENWRFVIYENLPKGSGDITMGKSIPKDLRFLAMCSSRISWMLSVMTSTSKIWLGMNLHLYSLVKILIPCMNLSTEASYEIPSFMENSNLKLQIISIYVVLQSSV